MKTLERSAKHRPGTLIRWIILPLLMAGVTVALIYETDRNEREIAISVTFDNLADSLLLVNSPRPSVRLLVSGTAAALKTIEPEGAFCKLDVSGLGEGHHTVQVRPTDIRLPRGVSLSKLLTPSVTIQLEARVRKKVDVFAVLEGTVAPGFAVVAVNLKPNPIVLTGASSMLAGIQTVRTYPINLEGASEPFKKEVPLNLPEAVTVAPPPRIVIAEIDIRERVVTRVLEDLPVAALGAATDYRIDPQGITLTVSGPQAIVDTIESDPTFSVTVNLDGLAPGTHLLKATIKLPVGTKLVHVTPEQFSVTISN
jgi:YbbR domain-containing protein